MSIYDYLSQNGSFQAFLASIKIAGLENILRDQGPWTLFAPTDVAFGRLCADHLDALLRSRETMCELVSFHLLPGVLTAEEIKYLPTRESLQGKRLLLCRGRIHVNGAKVIRADQVCRNGVLHHLDRVLTPARVRF